MKGLHALLAFFSLSAWNHGKIKFSTPYKVKNVKYVTPHHMLHGPNKQHIFKVKMAMLSRSSSTTSEQGVPNSSIAWTVTAVDTIRHA